MIEVLRKRRGFPYRQEWFARSASPLDALGAVAYYQFLGARRPPLCVRRAFTTMHIDLARDPEAILADMHKNVRGEIRKAEGDSLLWERDIDHAAFAEFHDSFARIKGIEGVGSGKLESLGDSLLLTRVLRNDATLAQHAYIVDRGESRARFLYSSSGRFEGADGALVGRANRWCHWKDMLFLRDAGITTYDMGGIAEGIADTTLVGINEFKMRFGGTKVREDHFLSPLYLLASLMGASH